MENRMVQTSSFAIMAGMFVAVIQTCLLYFLEYPWVTLLASFLLDLFICQYILENSFSHNYCLRYLMVVELFTLTVGIPAWLGLYGTILPYQPLILYLFILHMAVPFLFCTIRYLADVAPRFRNYNRFFWEFSLMLWISLIAGFLYCYVYQKMSLLDQEHYNLIPFHSISALIEAHIKQGTSLHATIVYLVGYMAFFVPVGFYLQMLFGRHFILLRILSFLLLPAAIELAQYFLMPSQCEIDDIFPAFIGCILGSILYSLLNRICQSLHEEDFLHRPSRTSFYL